MKKLLQLRFLAPKFIEWRNGRESWKLGGSRFSISKVWNEIRIRHEQVAWAKLLWSSPSVPRHTYVAWMAIHDRLPTLVILSWCNIHREVFDWDRELHWAVSRCMGKAFISALLRMAWRAHLYFIWVERNKRLYRKQVESPGQVAKNIRETLCIALSRLSNVKDDDVNRALSVNWGLQLFS
ncbi:hypothetical protein PTKIN_Ptkin07bG0031900 [Pterospermum kingtungense]